MCRTGITSFIIYSLLALLLKHRPGAASYALGLGLTRPPALPRAQLERLGLFPLPELPVQEPQGGGGGQAEFEGKANPPPPGRPRHSGPEGEKWNPGSPEMPIFSALFWPTTRRHSSRGTVRPPPGLGKSSLAVADLPTVPATGGRARRTCLPNRNGWL